MKISICIKVPQMTDDYNYTDSTPHFVILKLISSGVQKLEYTTFKSLFTCQKSDVSDPLYFFNSPRLIIGEAA